MFGRRNNSTLVVVLLLTSLVLPFLTPVASMASSVSHVAPQSVVMVPMSEIGSRAQQVTWTETDWSNGNFNTSIDVEPELTPGELALSSDIDDMIDLFTPTTHDGIYSIVDFQDGLHISASSPGSGLNNTTIYSCSPEDLSCSQVADLEEDLVYEMFGNANHSRLYIPGAAPKNVSMNGSLYHYDGGNLTRFDIQDITSQSVGVLSAAEMGTKIFLTSRDTNGRAYIYRSVTDGQTWFKVFNLGPKPYNRSLNAMGLSGDTIFVQPDGFANEGAKIYKYNGTVWKAENIPGLSPEYGSFITTGSGSTDYFMDGGNLFSHQGSEWSQVESPFSPLVQSVGLYDPTGGNFTTSSTLIQGRIGHTSDLVSGTVVTVGGMVGLHVQASVEHIEASSGNVTSANDLQTARSYHASTVLQDGTIFISGGLIGLPPTGYSATTSCERYNLTSGWSVASSLTEGRYNHTATLLNDGKVLVTGGMTGSGYLSTSQIFDPSGGWGPASPMNTARANHVAILLNNGSVLVAGGRDGSGALDNAEVYVPGTDTWYDLPNVPYQAFDAATSLLPNGNVLVSGGTTDGLTGTTSSSVLDTTVDTWSLVIDMGSARFGHSSAPTMGGISIVGGATNPSTFPSTIEVFSSGSFSSTGTSMDNPRLGHEAVIVNSSTVLLVGGVRSTAFSDLMSKAAGPAGNDGLVVGTTNGTVHVSDGSGAWSSSVPIPGGLEIMDALVYHGRVHVSTRGTAKVMVASAVPSGELVSTPHKFNSYLENATIEWDAILPSNTGFKVQLRSARNLTDLNDTNFTGPDGTTGTFFTTTATDIGGHHMGNDWLQYRVLLDTSDPKVTPIVQEIRVIAMVSPLLLTSISVTPQNITITSDEIVDFNATGYDQFGLEMDITPAWSSTGGSIHPLTGNYTPRDAGQWEIYARASGKEGMTNITVLPGALASIVVTPESWFGSIDEYVVFEAIGLDQWGNQAPSTIEWAIEGEAGTIDTDGNLTPIRPGTWKVFANDTSLGISGNATAIIWTGEPANITISPLTVTMKAGTYQLFEAKVFDAAGNLLDQPVEWKSNGGGKIDHNGNFSATRTGTWSIFANLSLYSLSAEATVTVEPDSLYEIEVAPEDKIMIAGTTETFKARPIDKYGNVLPMSIKWSVTGGGTLSNGIYSPTVAGLFTIYANASGLSGSALVRVTPSSLYQITVDRSSEVMDAGNGTKFYAKAEDQFGNVINNVTLVRTLSDPELGIIDYAGGFMAGPETMTGTITVSASQGSTTASATIEITVQGPKPPKPVEPPFYYFILEIVILIVIVAVSALVAFELLRK